MIFQNSEVPLTTAIPTNAQVVYDTPRIPTILSLATFLVLLATPTLLSNSYPVHAYRPPLQNDKTLNDNAEELIVSSYSLDTSLTIILPLVLGALLGPSITSNSILSTSNQSTFIDIGYLGLLLLIFEAGVSLDAASLQLMRENASLSTLVALTGALVPIALSMGMGMGAYGYSGLQAFASGASLASTSLGTTLALLSPPPAKRLPQGDSSHVGIDLRRTRVGCVLVCAALLDDIFGLVIAGIIPGLAQTNSGTDAKVMWPIIVRPILVSIAFGIGTPLAAMCVRNIIIRFPAIHRSPRPQALFVVMILVLMAFIAGSGYAGTSELFGAYLAGAFVSHLFPPQVEQAGDGEGGNAAHAAFTAYIQPILTNLLAPLFFASIGFALPIKQMFTTHPDAVQVTTNTQSSPSESFTIIDYGKASHQVIWRGLLYAVIMVLGKMIVGFWFLVWPTAKSKATQKTARTIPLPSAPRDIESRSSSVPSRHELDRTTPQPQTRTTSNLPSTRIPTAANPSEPTRMRSALLLGFAMVARGEIALIVAELSRPLLIGPAAASITATGADGVSETRTSLPDEEPFAVVIWAIIVSTVGGAVGVGALIASWRRTGINSMEPQG